MKTLYFIRHGQSEANINYDILQNTQDEDVKLTEKGKLDAVRAGWVLEDHLKNAPPESFIFLVSPYRRTRQTFERIAAVAGVNDPGVEYAVDLVEEIVEHKMNLVGNPENWKRFKDYEKSGWKHLDHIDVKYDGGESLADVKDRASAFLKDCSGSDWENIVVVSHGLFIKMALSLIDGIDSDNVPHPNNGEVIVRKVKGSNE